MFLFRKYLRMHLKNRTYSTVSHIDHKCTKQYIRTVKFHISKENPFLKNVNMLKEMYNSDII